MTTTTKRGEEKGGNGERRGRVKSRNMYKRPMEKGNDGGTELGGGGGEGRGE